MLSIKHETIAPKANALMGERSQSSLFYKEVLEGLTSRPKYLPSKYFYDKAGDHIFQEIMSCKEYYPFGCELEIFQQKTAALAAPMMRPGTAFDLIELGAGDCTKSVSLLRYLVDVGADFTFMPIDISSNIISYLQSQLPLTIPGLKIKGLSGEYFSVLEKASKLSKKRKVVLFLGSTLGNMSPAESRQFCRELRKQLVPGDMVLIGLDLKKSPRAILAAYNDKEGITKKFNLNLLQRINRELDADFDFGKFDHFPVYDPRSGACKSYLISMDEQEVTLRCNGGEETIGFAKDEEIFMEISQKYTVDQVDYLADQASFETLQRFYDSRGWFIDALWLAV
jgi:dimethylhistidine N-methyltransferase